MKLSILICTLESRRNQFDRLIRILQPQLTDEVEIKFLRDQKQKTIGYKRNQLLQAATGDYVAFIDDDDRISPNYVQLLLKGIETDPDCCSLIGQITFNGKGQQKFIHSIGYTSYFEQGRIYYRPPNHLNCIRASIAKQFIFDEINMYEDTHWAMAICNAGVLKTEYKIEETLYYYDYIQRE